MVKKEKESAKIKNLKSEARKYSIKEGIFASAKNSFGDHFLSPFAVAINMSNSLIAMLSSIAGILGPISQMFGSRLIEKYSRKKIILRLVFFESLMWLPMVLIAILFYKGIMLEMLPFLLLITFAVYIIIANMEYPARFSWWGDIIDKKYRGRWFAKRNLLIGFVSIFLVIFTSLFLDYFKKHSLEMFGFMILFSTAVILRLICWTIYKKEYEPKIELKKGDYFSFWDYLIKLKKDNFGRFSIFMAFLNFACGITSPLLAVYLLRGLDFSYTIYMVIIFAGSGFGLLFLGLWGKIADRYGNYKVLTITTILIPLIPILWILSSSPIYFILVPAIIGGLSWSGFHLSAGNFIYDNVSKEKRGLAVSYYSMLTGIGTFGGAGIGAFLIKFLPTNLLESITIIFIIGGVARMIVVATWIPKIKEIKKKRKIKSSETFSHIFLKEAKPTILAEVHEIISIKKYLRDK